MLALSLPTEKAALGVHGTSDPNRVLLDGVALAVMWCRRGARRNDA